MADSGPLASHFLGCLEASARQAAPFRHWLLDGVFPEAACAAIDALPVAAPRIGDTLGKRETNNSARLFFGEAQRARHPICAEIAAALQSEAVTTGIRSLCGVALGGAYLRIEYCLDTDGFWLEPHTDIGAKLFTMLIYLSEQQGCEAWGTDILDAQMNLVATAPYRRNTGLIFIPAADTWHGFHRRPINGARRSLIVNYVEDEWRARHELAYPQAPVRD
jgi:hypothetical protein